MKIVEEQQRKIDALEYLITKINLEPVINDLDYFIGYLSPNESLESHRSTLIEVWEKLNTPHKWEEE